MSGSLIATALVAAVYLHPLPAAAETILQSAALKGGAGGTVCACSNLTNQPIVIYLTVQHQNSATSCLNQDLGSLSVESCSSNSTSVTSCRVGRQDGSSVTSRQLACTLSAIDGAGNPTTAVPLQKKKR